MVKVLTHLIAPTIIQTLCFTTNGYGFWHAAFAALRWQYQSTTSLKPTRQLNPLPRIRGSKGGHLHLFTSPKDAEDDFEVWNPEEFPPEAGIKSQAESRRILTSNEATISQRSNTLLSRTHQPVLLQGSTTSCWQYLERPKSCIWQSGCFLSLYHVSWKDPGNIVAGWDPMLKMEIINYSLFISEGHSKLQSQERKCEPLRGCANWQFCYIKSRGSKLHLHLQVKGTTRTCQVEPVQNKLVSNTAILRSSPQAAPLKRCVLWSIAQPFSNHRLWR